MPEPGGQCRRTRGSAGESGRAGSDRDGTSQVGSCRSGMGEVEVEEAGSHRVGASRGGSGRSWRGEVEVEEVEASQDERKYRVKVGEVRLWVVGGWGGYVGSMVYVGEWGCPVRVSGGE